MIAWHFLPADGMTRYEPRQKVAVGEWLTVDPDRLALCEYGLHASERLIDALGYAPGPVVCQVELGGKILRGHDKVCAEKRRVIAMADATELLHTLACDQAAGALHLSRDEASRAIAQRAIDTKRRWLRGKASNSELAAARDAARDAAWGAASAAARDAAWDAASAAVSAAAWGAAWAAWDAASPAWDAAWAGAGDAANIELTRRVCALLGMEFPEKASVNESPSPVGDIT